MRLDDPDLVKLCGFWLRLAIIDIRLKLVPHSLNRSWIFESSQRYAILTHASPAIIDDAHRVERLIERASGRHCIFDMSCLRQALALRSYLRKRHGLEGKILFGTKKDGAGKQAFHAWLEIPGAASIDSEFSKFR